MKAYILQHVAAMATGNTNDVELVASNSNISVPQEPVDASDEPSEIDPANTSDEPAVNTSDEPALQTSDEPAGNTSDMPTYVA